MCGVSPLYSRLALAVQLRRECKERRAVERRQNRERDGGPGPCGNGETGD